MTSKYQGAGVCCIKMKCLVTRFPFIICNWVHLFIFLSMTITRKLYTGSESDFLHKMGSEGYCLPLKDGLDLVHESRIVFCVFFHWARVCA